MRKKRFVGHFGELRRRREMGDHALRREALRVLGLPPTDPPDEEALQSAFKALAIKLHPDRNRGNEADATERCAHCATIATCAR